MLKKPLAAEPNSKAFPPTVASTASAPRPYTGRCNVEYGTVAVTVQVVPAWGITAIDKSLIFNLTLAAAAPACLAMRVFVTHRASQITIQYRYVCVTVRTSSSTGMFHDALYRYGAQHPAHGEGRISSGHFYF